MHRTAVVLFVNVKESKQHLSVICLSWFYLAKMLSEKSKMYAKDSFVKKINAIIIQCFLHASKKCDCIFANRLPNNCRKQPKVFKNQFLVTLRG